MHSRLFRASRSCHQQSQQWLQSKTSLQRLPAAEPAMASEQEKPAKANAQQSLPSLQRLPAAEPAMASEQEKPAKANAQQPLPSLQRLPAAEPAMASEQDKPAKAASSRASNGFRARQACKCKCAAESPQPAKAASSRASNGFRARKACKGKCTADSSQPAKAANSRASNGFTARKHGKANVQQTLQGLPSLGKKMVFNSGEIIIASRNLELHPISSNRRLYIYHTLLTCRRGDYLHTSCTAAACKCTSTKAALAVGAYPSADPKTPWFGTAPTEL